MPQINTNYNIYIYIIYNSFFFRVFFSIIIAWVIIATIYDIINQIIEFKKQKTIESNVDLIYKEKSKISGSNVLENNNNSKIINNDQSTKIIPLKSEATSILHKILISTLLYSNTEQIFRTDNGGKITCLNGIRLFSMVWIIFGHTFNYLTDRSYFFLLCKIDKIDWWTSLKY